MSVVTIIIWQAFGSIGLKTRNFWKFYLANVIGLILFVVIFTFGSSFFKTSLSDWIEGSKWLLDGVLVIPIIGLGIGWIRENTDTRPIDDVQDPNNNKQSNPTE
jgi:membrane protein DedA with SNARE-associated domain